ncbi:MAG: hypothetical protein AAGG09_16430 [Pseudomonadota bacterium]
MQGEPCSSADQAPLPLQPATLERFARSVLQEFLSEWRGAAPLDLAGDVSLRDGHAALDSLEMLDVVASLNTRFALHETGIEDYLLARPTLREWGDLLHTHLGLMGERATLAFKTSGSTGAPKSMRHAGHDLLREVHALVRDLRLTEAAPSSTASMPPHVPLDDLMAPRHSAVRPVSGARCGAPAEPTQRRDEMPGPANQPRIVCLVPCHTMFGFLFTALLPDDLGWPVVDLSRRAPTALARIARSGDVVVATPHLLGLALSSLDTTCLPPGMRAIVSGGPCPRDLLERAAAKGLAVMDVYGATETGGIGWRRAAKESFTLFSHLDLLSPDSGPAEIWHQDNRLDLQDQLEWCGERRFVWRGRRDHVVQIGGVNVSPGAVAQSLIACSGVKDAAVRLNGTTGRLKAFVVPDPEVMSASGEREADCLEQTLRTAMRGIHAAPARPQSYTFGTALPVGPSGKPSDW